MAALLPRFLPDDHEHRVDRAIRAGEAQPVQIAAGVAGGDWRRLRGLPVLTYGVGGTMFGSRPEREVLRLDKI